MDVTSRRLLIAPAVLAAAGLALYLGASAIGDTLALLPDSAAVLFLRHAGGIGMFLALAWLTARCCDLLLRRVAATSRGGLPFPRLLSDLLRVLLFAVAFLLILQVVFDQSATGLLTVSSVVIAVIGFALRNVTSDLFSGIALGFDPLYRIGDWIETVQGSVGRVSEISWRTTRLTDRNGVTVVVPNGLVAGQRLINYSGGERDHRVTLRVPLDPTLPVAKAKRILLSGALAAARQFRGLSPDVLLTDCGDGVAIYAVRFRVPDVGREAVCRDAVASWTMNALHCAGQTIQRGGPGDAIQVPWASSREAVLSHVDLFRGFDVAERADLAAKMRAREVAAGQVVVRQGDPGDVLYVLAEGILDVEVHREQLAPIRDRLAPGEVFGEISLLTGEPRTATVSAAFDSLVYEIHRGDLQPILQRRPEIAEGLATVMAEHQAHNRRGEERVRENRMPMRDDLLVRLRHLFRI